MIKKAINGIKKIYNNDKPLIIEWIMVGIISFIILCFFSSGNFKNVSFGILSPPFYILYILVKYNFNFLLRLFTNFLFKAKNDTVSYIISDTVSFVNIFISNFL